MLMEGKIYILTHIILILVCHSGFIQNNTYWQTKAYFSKTQPFITKKEVKVRQ